MIPDRRKLPRLVKVAASLAVAMLAMCVLMALVMLLKAASDALGTEVVSVALLLSVLFLGLASLAYVALFT